MKIQKILITFALLFVSHAVFAHCPANFKEEKVCFMLEKNTLYIYDKKFEHNGPYKDFEKAEMKSIETLSGTQLVYKKLARGIYKIESTEILKALNLNVSLNKKNTVIKISHE